MKHYLLGLLFIFVSVIGCGRVAPTEAPSTSTSETVALEKPSENTPLIVDVRTVEEWNEGHAPCSVNYPLDQIESKAEILKTHQKIILVCRSGARAEKAKERLEAIGIKNTENLGSWENIKCP